MTYVVRRSVRIALGCGGARAKPVALLSGLGSRPAMPEPCGAERRYARKANACVDTGNFVTASAKQNQLRTAPPCVCNQRGGDCTADSPAPKCRKGGDPDNFGDLTHRPMASHADGAVPGLSGGPTATRSV